MLYIQKSVSENAGIAVIGVEKYKHFLGENTPKPPPPPTIKWDTTPNFLSPTPTTIYHFSTLGIVWSLFVDGPPTDEFLKNALQCIELTNLKCLILSHLHLAAFSLSHNAKPPIRNLIYLLRKNFIFMIRLCFKIYVYSKYCTVLIASYFCTNL